jgi:hypothetical protein
MAEKYCLGIRLDGDQKIAAFGSSYRFGVGFNTVNTD